MSDESGTIDAIAEQLALAILPLKNAVADAASFRAFMLRVGWGAQSLPPQWSALAAKIADVAVAVEALRAARSTAAATSLLEKTSALYAAISAINTAPAGIADPAAFLADIARRLFDLLLVDYISAELPVLSSLLRAAGVITETPHAETANQFAHVEVRFRFEELGRLISDPASIPNRIYGWGNPDIDFDLLATHLHEHSLAVGLQTRFGPADPVLAAGLQASPDQTARAVSSQLSIALAELNLAGKPMEIGLALLELPPEAGHPAGLIIQPMIPSTIGVEETVSADWKLQLRAGSDIARTFGIILRPDGMDVRYPFQPGAAPPSVGFGGALVCAPKVPTLLFGSPKATRLEFMGARAALGFEVVNGEFDLSLGVELHNLTLVLSAGESDSFVRAIMGGGESRIEMSLGMEWSRRNGLHFLGSGAFEVTAHPHLSLGPVCIDDVTLRLVVPGTRPPDMSFELGAGISGELGPVAFVVEEIGLRLYMNFTPGNAGPFDLQIGFKPPRGIGLSVDAGPVSGGGNVSLNYELGRYSGVLHLQVLGVAVSAIGLLDTKLPDGRPGYSFLLIICTEFSPIQLGYGFTLNGVGGIAGIHRSLNVEALRLGVYAGSLDHILFPKDPVRNAPQLISDLSLIFPPTEGQYTFGPMAKLGWGTPTLIEISLCIIIELPSPVRIALLGQIGMFLPKREAAVVEIHLDFVAIVDFGAKLLSLDATLRDSRVAAFTLSGDMALRLGWGEQPNFAVALGGFHPHFPVPPGFPALRRLTLALGAGDYIRLTCQTYQALTTNSFQFGARVELFVDVGVSIHGWLGFDALFIFSPFSFEVDFTAGLEVAVGSVKLAGVSFEGSLSGPTPWRVRGQAALSLLFFEVTAKVDEKFGEERHEELPPVDPWEPLYAALIELRNWSAAQPAGAAPFATLTAPVDSSTVLFDPCGRPAWRQKVVPLDRTLTRFGNAPTPAPVKYTVDRMTADSAPVSFAPVKDFFAAAQFQSMSDAEKLSRPSFETMDAGVQLADKVRLGFVVPTEVIYETRLIDSALASRAGTTAPLAASVQLALGNLAGASALLHGGMRGFLGEPRLKQGAERFVVVSTDALARHGTIPGKATKGAAAEALDAYLTSRPAERGRWQVVPEHELEEAA